MIRFPHDDITRLNFRLPNQLGTLKYDFLSTQPFQPTKKTLSIPIPREADQNKQRNTSRLIHKAFFNNFFNENTFFYSYSNQSLRQVLTIFEVFGDIEVKFQMSSTPNKILSDKATIFFTANNENFLHVANLGSDFYTGNLSQQLTSKNYRDFSDILNDGKQSSRNRKPFDFEGGYLDHQKTDYHSDFYDFVARNTSNEHNMYDQSKNKRENYMCAMNEFYTPLHPLKYFPDDVEGFINKSPKKSNKFGINSYESLNKDLGSNFFSIKCFPLDFNIIQSTGEVVILEKDKIKILDGPEVEIDLQEPKNIVGLEHPRTFVVSNSRNSYIVDLRCEQIVDRLKSGHGSLADIFAFGNTVIGYSCSNNIYVFKNLKADENSVFQSNTRLSLFQCSQNEILTTDFSKVTLLKAEDTTNNASFELNLPNFIGLDLNDNYHYYATTEGVYKLSKNGKQIFVEKDLRPKNNFSTFQSRKSKLDAFDFNLSHYISDSDIAGCRNIYKNMFYDEKIDPTIVGPYHGLVDQAYPYRLIDEQNTVPKYFIAGKYSKIACAPFSAYQNKNKQCLKETINNLRVKYENTMSENLMKRLKNKKLHVYHNDFLKNVIDDKLYSIQESGIKTLDQENYSTYEKKPQNPNDPVKNILDEFSIYGVTATERFKVNLEEHWEKYISNIELDKKNSNLEGESAPIYSQTYERAMKIHGQWVASELENEYHRAIKEAQTLKTHDNILNIQQNMQSETKRQTRVNKRSGF